MDKEDILSKSRADHKNGDEREKQIRMRSAIPAFVGMGAFGITLMLLEFIFLDTVILSRGISLVVGTVATQNWYLAFTLKKKIWYLNAAFFTCSTVISTLSVINAFRTMM